MRDADSTGAGRAWDAWHAANDHVVTHSTNSMQVGVSLGTFAGAGSLIYEIGQAATSIALAGIKAAIIAAIVTAVGFFVSRALNKHFPPARPTPPVRAPIENIEEDSQ